MDNTIYQISLLQALVKGYYDGVISVGELRKNADTAIGTFLGANGEMIMVDHNMYRANIDGKIELVSDNELIPFSNATTFSVDKIINITAKDITDLKKQLNEYKNKNHKNEFIVIRIDGLFSSITYRSIPKQNKPYKPLDYVVEHEQKVYAKNNIKGTIIGFCFPAYLSNINTVDYHMHFIDELKTCGGHVLDLSFKDISIKVSIKNELKLILPKEEDFNNYSFNNDLDAIKKVEE